MKESSTTRRPFDVFSFIRRHFEEGPREWDYTVEEITAVLVRAKEVFRKQPTLLTVYSPLKVLGDVHGQYADLLNVFQCCGWPYNTRYLFLGDYIDRGTCSLEVIMLLFACKIAYPNDMYLLRGNHEIASTNRNYGFWTDLRIRYHQHYETIFDRFSTTFAEMPVAALVNENILCLHGGITPKLKSLQDIRDIKRPIVEPLGLAEDLLWADPSDTDGFATNTDRGCSYTFGEDVVLQKCNELGVRMIVRAHQAMEKGYGFFARNRVITLFSAPGYEPMYDNLGAVMKIDRHGGISFFTFSSAVPIHRKLPRLEGAATADC